MIIKSFNLNELKVNKSNFLLFYGVNEGHKNEVINNVYLDTFKGEIIKYDESQILENKESFLENCFNESLFSEEKIIIINRVTAKMFDITNHLVERELINKKIIFKAGILDKKSKIRTLFEKNKNLVCIPFYEDNNSTLYKIAFELFKLNNISISSENINLIVESCSNDRENLKNEMNKILNFCYKKDKINREEIIKLTNLHEDENYFELVDNCLAKNHNKVCKIINSNSFTKTETIIIIRSFLSRIKRLIGLKKQSLKTNNISETINNFRPLIFWKDKDIVEKQINSWTIKEVDKLLEDLLKLEIDTKKNYDISTNLIFDFILNISTKANN